MDGEFEGASKTRKNSRQIHDSIGLTATGARVLAADLHASEERLRAPRAAVERRPRRLPGNPDLACDLVAERADALPERSRKRLYPVLASLQSVLDSVSPHLGIP